MMPNSLFAHAYSYNCAEVINGQRILCNAFVITHPSYILNYYNIVYCFVSKQSTIYTFIENLSLVLLNITPADLSNKYRKPTSRIYSFSIQSYFLLLLATVA